MEPPSPIEENWEQIGGRIRSARVEAGVSVRELGRRVGVSPSHISQVERGLGSFSVSALYAVASHLGVSMDSLFDESQPRSSTSSSPAPSGLDGTMVLRAADRPSITLREGPRWERLTIDAQPGLEFLEVIYEPVAAGSEPEFSRHAGVEYGVVVEGVLDVQVGFESTVLGPGDSIRVESSQPHRYWNRGPHRVRAVWLETRADEPGQ